MARLTGLPAIIWAMLWAGLALGVIGGALWTAWLTPARRRQTHGTMRRQTPCMIEE